MNINTIRNKTYKKLTPIEKHILKLWDRGDRIKAESILNSLNKLDGDDVESRAKVVMANVFYDSCVNYDKSGV